MNPFTNTRDAKEFLIAQIVNEAEREGKPLTDIERRMLYFTETAWMPEDTWQASEVFDLDYDQMAYERRIAQLATKLKSDSQRDQLSWNQAVAALRSEDHYLLILIDTGLLKGALARRPPFDIARLILTAIAAVGILLALVFSYHAVITR